MACEIFKGHLKVDGIRAIENGDFLVVVLDNRHDLRLSSSLYLLVQGWEELIVVLLHDIETYWAVITCEVV